MKKFCLLLICLVVMPIIFFFFSENANPYQSLINCIIEEQNNSDDLYNDYIKIYGLCRWISNGSEHGPYERNIKLRDLILTNNCIIETAPSEYYYLFSEIEYIKDSNGNLIWGKI